MKHFISLFFIFVFCEFTNSQPNDIKFKLAQNYERGGDWEKALPLYEDLYRSDSSNVVFFDALRQSYLQVKRYNDAISLIENRLKKFSNDISLYASLGTAYAKADKESLAIQVWEKCILLDKKNLVMYKTVAEAARENRMWETSIALFRKGRTEIGTSSLFATELGSLFAILMRYEEATTEYLLLLNDSPQQVSYVQSRLTAFTGKPEGRKAAIEVVQRTLATQRENISLIKLYAWLLMEGKDFPKAFEVYKEIDKKTKANGNELFQFAERIYRDKEFFVAASAYNEILQHYPRLPQAVNVRFNFARSVEELAKEKDSTVLKLFAYATFSISFEEAISSYSALAKEQGKTEIAAQSLYRIALIQAEQFSNSSDALQTLEKLQQSVLPASPMRIEGKLLSAELFLQKGDTTSAFSMLRAILTEQRIQSSQRERASFRLAELYYFIGNFQEASKRLEELTKVLATDIANDALTLQLFLGTHRGKEEFLLKKFAATQFLIRQKKNPEAIESFETLIAQNPQSELADDMLLEVGILQTKISHHDDAIATFQKFLSQFEESLLRDKALFLLAEIYERNLHQTSKAIASYEKLLNDFPQSLFANEARKRIRILRGDTL